MTGHVVRVRERKKKCGRPWNLALRVASVRCIYVCTRMYMCDPEGLPVCLSVCVYAWEEEEEARASPKARAITLCHGVLFPSDFHARVIKYVRAFLYFRREFNSGSTIYIYIFFFYSFFGYSSVLVSPVSRYIVPRYRRPMSVFFLEIRFFFLRIIERPWHRARVIITEDGCRRDETAFLVSSPPRVTDIVVRLCGFSKRHVRR